MRPIRAPASGAAAKAAPPTFAVIVSAYQAAPLIGEAIESVLAQTMRPNEIVVCDDGSTDDLEGALAPFRPHVTLIRQRRRGNGAAKNAAARAASADFVVPLDADDVFLPERIEALGELATVRPDLDILTTDSYFEAEGRTVGRFYESNTFEVADQRAAILRRNFLLSNSAARRSRFLAVGGFDESLRAASDWALWIRMFLDGAEAGLVDEPLARYRLHPASVTADRVAAFRGRVAVLGQVVGDPRLSPAEHEVVRESLRHNELRLLLVEAAAALRGELAGRRRRLFAVATNRGFGRRMRARAGAAAVIPPLAGGGLVRELAHAEHGARAPSGGAVSVGVETRPDS
jgi:glycosyltransferase involved in cell wall biosynthesis